MDKVKIYRKNHSDLIIETEQGIAWEIRDHFSFFVPGYKYMPKYRNGIWDGKIKIFDYNRKQLPAGLYKKLVKFCTDRNYKMELDDPNGFGSPAHKNKINPNKIWDFIKTLNIHSKNKPILVRDYQFNAICKSIQDDRILLLSPTASGKSLIIYCLMRYWQTQREDKTLIIVPTTSLVEQMYTDFEDYSSHDENWSVHDECHKIYSGKEKINVQNPVFISTWQSIYKLPKTWFRQFGVIFGDEAHRFTSDSLTKSMKKAENAKHRVGTTGTLDGTKTNELVLQGVFGPVFKVTTTKSLQDNNTIAQLDINCIKLIYPDDIKQSFKKVSYQNEIDWIVRNNIRNDFIVNLALKLKGNTLLLFQFVEKHGKVLYGMLQDKSEEDRRIFYVSGETDKLDREAVRKIVETQTNSITAASQGVFAVGINIRNIHNIIFATPSKSQILVLQSIGRGLRKSDNNKTTQLYDISDDLSWKSRKNYSLLHSEHRLKIYKNEQFNVKHFKVKL